MLPAASTTFIPVHPCERISSIQRSLVTKEGVILQKYVIHGGHPLFGEIEISGAKNAAVAITPPPPGGWLLPILKIFLRSATSP